MRPDPIALGQPAFVHGVLGQFDQGIGQSLAGGSLVIWAQAPVERVERRPQARPALGIEQAVDHVHTIAKPADVEAAAGVVGLGVVEEAVGVGDMARA